MTWAERCGERAIHRMVDRIWLLPASRIRLIDRLRSVASTCAGEFSDYSWWRSSSNDQSRTQCTRLVDLPVATYKPGQKLRSVICAVKRGQLVGGLRGGHLAVQPGTLTGRRR